MLAFRYPKNPESVARYAVLFQEQLTGTPDVIFEANAHSVIALTVTDIALASDGLTVHFMVGGGSDGTAWVLDVHVTAVDGSRLVVPVRLSVADA